jgi:predicted CXXCH cytochrome family protein
LAAKKARMKMIGSRHKPVADKLCHQCHDMPEKQGTGWNANLPTLLYPVEDLCLQCHEPAQGTFTHGPSASGNCAVCHLAHTSRHPHLQKESPMKGLCRSCHDPADLLEQEMHAENDEFDCIDCHNPHASEREYLLLEEFPRVSRAND